MDNRRISGVEVEQTVLPGIGLRHEFTTHSGRRIGVVSHRSGRRDLVIYDAEDPDKASETIQLNEEEANALVELLGAPRIVQRLQALHRDVEGLVSEKVPVPPGSPYDGRPMGDARGRTRTGASIVAVVRGSQVFASPAYIERYGEPLHPEELQFHRILAMRKPYHTGNSPRFTWQLGENGGELRDFPVTPLMTANDMSALNGALVCGEGLLLTGDVMAKPFVESGMVRRVLAGWTGPEVDFNAVFAGGRLVSPKVRAFVDFLVEKLNFDANYMLAQCPGAKLAQQQKAQEDAALESSGKRILEKVAASAV